ncbi:MAG: TIGR03087 family PEP-CTERM/XrtA system glycosyltransferase [Pseudomonadota bacterium]
MVDKPASDTPKEDVAENRTTNNGRRASLNDAEISGKPGGEALFIAHRIPYPPDKGDKIRSWRIFERLTQRYDTHLAAFVDDPEDFQHQEKLAAMAASLTLIPLTPLRARAKSALGLLTGAPLSDVYYRDGRMARAVDAVRARPLKLEMAFSSTMAQYLAAPPSDDRIRAIDFCDADSAKWAAYAKQKRFPMSAVYRREARTLRLLEEAVIDWADVSFAISPAEAAVLSGAPSNHAVQWFANGVDVDAFASDIEPRPDEKADVVFTGAMDYWANVDAALWFVESIWPLVRARAPDARFAIVGARPDPALLALNRENGVRVTGRVADIRPWLAGAKVAVAPMRIARGVQNKVLEAMAAARPIVLTSAAAEGIEATAGRDFLAKDDIVGFADAVTTLLFDRDLRRKFGSAARSRVSDAYRWGACLDAMDVALDEAALEKANKINTPMPVARDAT